jgi:hypothetical protein
MEKDLQTLLYNTLKEHGEIKFDVTFELKGVNLEVEIGENKNEQCDPIYIEI